MRELQPYFDRLLLIPGREITTFWGHFNIFGITEYIDYRAVAKDGRDVNAILRDARANGGIASINHADSPGGEICMGCAWEPRTDLDMNLVTGIEVINGGRIFLSSADFWDRELAEGAKLTAIGGSDNHNASIPAGTSGAIGWPTTVVEANELSVPAILDGIRRGRVFIDLTGSRDRIVDIDARVTASKNQPSEKGTPMGDILTAAAGDIIAFRVHVTDCPGAAIHVFVDGREAPPIRPIEVGFGTGDFPFNWTNSGGRHWVRVEVRDANGSLMLISNPIYITETPSR
jgi:hypothetical protein